VAPWALLLGAVAATGALDWLHGEWVRPLFGPVAPVPAVAVLVALGGTAVRRMEALGWLEVLPGARFSEAAAACGVFPSLFAVVVILVDARFGIPLWLTVPPPWSLLFYPVMGVAAEIAFHLLPLSALLLALGRRAAGRPSVFWGCAVPIALLEPLFQVAPDLADGSLSAIGVYTAVQVWAFGVAQFAVLRRYGLLSMYSFRVVYYLEWHVLWGALRAG